MATVHSKPTISFQVTLHMNESEARAFDALVGYGFEGFRDAFYKVMGEAYLKPHEAGLKTLFESVRAEIPSSLARIDEARKALKI